MKDKDIEVTLRHHESKRTSPPKGLDSNREVLLSHVTAHGKQTLKGLDVILLKAF